ncbi:MAG: formate C-acetyltransferase [Negativicutes bacterium]|jgi:formate C-acetyltransferase
MDKQRIERRKDALFSARDFSIERACIYTTSWQESEGLPVIVRRALATAAVLDNVAISIRDDELLAGNRTIRPRSGIASPEMDPYWILDELDSMSTRPQDSFIVSETDKSIYREQLYPYWAGRSLKDAVNSAIPAEVRCAQAENIFKLNQTDKGQGHIIPGYETVLAAGLGGLRTKIEQLRNQSPDCLLYQAQTLILAALQRHIARYAVFAGEIAECAADDARYGELQRIAAACRKIENAAPETFFEACQLFWFINLAAQYESNASSISPGRFDQYMYRFYTGDIAHGMTDGQIKDILHCLWLKMNDVVLLRSADSARYFAGFPTGYTIILGGLNPRGRCSVNELSYLALEAYQDICLPQPNLGVRINELTPQQFLIKTAETIRLGTGIPQIFNDEVIVPGFLGRGVSLEDARDYSVVGCVELSIPGKTYGLHDIALFNLLKVLELTIQERNGQFDDFAALLEAVKANTDKYAELMAEGSNVVEAGHRDHAPTPFLSVFVEDCLDKGADVSAGGARYNFSGVQGIGIANLSDSLYNIKKTCFEQKTVSLPELAAILGGDYRSDAGGRLKNQLINKGMKYGNDCDEVDELGAEVLAHYCKTVERHHNLRGGIFIPGAYTVSAHIPLGAVVGATADGRMAGEQLADGGLSPMTGRDCKGPTAVLKSVSKLDNYLLSNGSLLNMKFHPSALAGQTGILNMTGFLRAFMKLKIQHIQFNVVSADTLRAAQFAPEKYKNLVIRVAGYSAIFVDLDKAIQEDIIKRTEHVF